MSRILPAIDTLVQHLSRLKHQPEAYRPERCPHCGKGSVWCHGFYTRLADREGVDGEYLDPVPIPRYFCSHCRRTCSCLPACIAPRRWYLWAAQQAAMVLVLDGSSFQKIAAQYQADRRTISRWWHRLKAQFLDHGFHLRNRFPELGRHASVCSFWSACLKHMSLAEAMLWLECDGVLIP